MNTGDNGLRSEPDGGGQKIARTVQTVTRILLGAFLVFAGTSHLTVARAEFLAQVLIDKAGVARYVHFGIPTKNEVHVLLVDRQGGTIVWRTIGSFDEAKGSALATAIETYLRRAEVS